MKPASERKVATIRYAEYSAAFKYLVEQGLDCKFILQPKQTQRTEKIGEKYSPDMVCTPFKTILGSLVEALEAGADTIIMPNGICRLSYYGELFRKILLDEGYEFDFINLNEYAMGGKTRDLIKGIGSVNPKVKMTHLISAGMESIKMVEYLDEITYEYYKGCGFDPTGGWRKAYKRFLAAMYRADTKAAIEKAYLDAKQGFDSTPLVKPAHPLKVGVIGEFYTAVDSFSNREVEDKLAGMGVEVHRWMNLSHRLIHYPGEKNLNVEIREYCTYEMGPTSTANIWAAKHYAEQGFHGLVHIKSANCTPEIDIVPILQKLSGQYKIPLLILTCDTQTSDVGLMTRLEAFYDMIEAKGRQLK
ncbi:MAG: hypothetical protein LUE87_08855 [Lachnospiraceae bacterium]|nr:hypothetical protein [Lachnospiraceae bacterium]